MDVQYANGTPIPSASSSKTTEEGQSPPEGDGSAAAAAADWTKDVTPTQEPNTLRRKMVPLSAACVARTVKKAEFLSNEDAKKSVQDEWGKLRNIGGSGKCVWNEKGIKHWSDVRKST